MDERDKRWWLQPLSYSYVGPQAAPTGLLEPVTKPSWGIGLSDGTPMITYGTPKDLPTQEPTGGITWPEKPTTYDYQDIVDEQKFTAEVPSQAGIDVAAQIDSFSRFNEPTLGLAASDPNLQGLTPFSTASTTMSPAQINAGMKDAIHHIDMIYGNETIVSDKDPSIRSAAKAITSKLPNWAISLGMKYGVPGTGFAGDRIETATTADSMVDILNNRVIMDAKKSGIPKDDLITSVITGVNPLIQTSSKQLSSAEDYVAKGGRLDKDDAVDMAYQQDSFRELVPQVISKPAPRATPAAINKVEEDEKARMLELAKQQAADQRKKDIAKAKAAKAQDAMIQAALQRAAQAQAERAMVDRARSIMDKYAGRRESPENYMSAEERNIVAAANVDTFAGVGDRSGEVREAMRSVGYGGSNWT